MSDDWCYQLNGFEIGPVPASEVRRLILKGRLSGATPIRREGMDCWTTADRLDGPGRPIAPVGDRTTVDTPGPTTVAETARLRSSRLLDDVGTIGIPVGVALVIPWERPAASLGALLLAALGGVLYRAILRGGRDLAAIRERAGTASETARRAGAGH